VPLLKRAREVKRKAVGGDWAKIITTPSALLRPSLIDGQATRMVPINPTASPTVTARDGKLRARTAATIAVKIGFAPFSTPVSADETRCSANGNRLSGKAIHSTPNKAMLGQAERGMCPRAEGNKASVAKPTRIRAKVRPLGPTASKP